VLIFSLKIIFFIGVAIYPCYIIFFVKKKKKRVHPPLYHNYNTKNKIKKDLTFLFFYAIIVVGGEMDQKSEHLFACGGATHPGVSRGSWSWTTPPGVPKILKKKKRSSPYIIPQHAGTCQEIFEKFFCKIFVKFGLSSLEIKKFLWYNIIGRGRRLANKRSGCPPNPPIFYYIIKGAALSSVFVKIFLENFLKKCCIIFLFVV
jgi:hypothetical protein